MWGSVNIDLWGAYIQRICPGDHQCACLEDTSTENENMKSIDFRVTVTKNTIYVWFI